MASRDLVNNLAKVQLLAPQNAGSSPLTNFTSFIMDTQGFESAMIVVSVGALTGVDTNDYLTFVLQESNSIVGASFTNVSITANQLNGVASPTADFGDQDRPFLSSLAGPGGTSGSMVTPTPALLPAPGVIPTLYTGLNVINVSTQASNHFSVGYIGSMRYIRLKGNFTGSPTVMYLDVMGYLGHPQFLPVLSNPAPITAT